MPQDAMWKLFMVGIRVLTRVVPFAIALRYSPYLEDDGHDGQRYVTNGAVGEALCNEGEQGLPIQLATLVALLSQLFAWPALMTFRTPSIFPEERPVDLMERED